MPASATRRTKEIRPRARGNRSSPRGAPTGSAGAWRDSMWWPTLYTHRREIVIKLEGRVVKRFPCPISEAVVPPLYPLPRGRG